MQKASSLLETVESAIFCTSGSQSAKRSAEGFDMVSELAVVTNFKFQAELWQDKCGH